MKTAVQYFESKSCRDLVGMMYDFYAINENVSVKDVSYLVETRILQIGTPQPQMWYIAIITFETIIVTELGK